MKKTLLFTLMSAVHTLDCDYDDECQATYPEGCCWLSDDSMVMTKTCASKADVQSVMSSSMYDMTTGLYNQTEMKFCTGMMKTKMDPADAVGQFAPYPYPQYFKTST